MGFFDLLLGKKQKPHPDDITPTGVSLNNAHSTTEYYGNYPSQNTQKAWAGNIPREFPAVFNQDAILHHDITPGGTYDDKNPQAYYDDRNADKLERDRVNTRSLQNTPQAIRAHSSAQMAEDNPYLGHPAQMFRRSNDDQDLYSFTRPFYPGEGYALSTGQHFSMASNRRAYGILGMQPHRNFRNTFRLEPVARDSENSDLSGVTAPTADPAIYVSPQSAPSSKWGL